MSNLATIVNNILADSGIDDINVVVTTGSYNNPAWITGLSWSKISSTPTTLSGYGITDAVPANRTITINGTAQDLSVNRSWSVGTVTSVDMTVPTGFSISGRPITSSGTLALTFAAGYSLPTTAVQSNWTTAYNDSIVSAAVTGTTTKTLTLTQQDGGTITASWTDYDTAPVTSVNAGTGISVNSTTGAVTVTNTGVLSVNGSTGAITGIATTAQLANYLPLAGGTMTGDILWAQTDRGITWSFNSDGAYIKFYNTGDGDTNSRLEFATIDNNDEYFRWGHVPSGGSFYESMRLVPVSSGNAEFTVSGKIIKSGGTTSQFLKANGDVDSTAYTPQSRTLTINGVAQDLSANRSWTITAGVSSVNAGTGISVNQTTGAVTVTNTGVLSVNGNTGTVTGIATTAQLANYLPLSGGTMTGLITSSVTDEAFRAQSNGTSTAWRGRVGSFNSTADKSSFLGNYTGRPGVFGHNNALTAWAELYVNTLGIYGQGNLYLSWFTYVKGDGNDTNYPILHSGNYNSYAPTLTGGGASGTWGITATGNALVNGNTSNSFGVLELSYAATNFNPSTGPRVGLSSMSIKMWNNYFNGSGLGSDYGTVMEYYSLSGHVDTQVYFDAGGGSWYRTASYAAGWQAWQKYVTENGGTWAINITGTSGNVGGVTANRIVYGDNGTATTYIAEASIQTALKSGFYTVGNSGSGFIPTPTSVNFLMHVAYYGEGNLAGIDLLANDSTSSNLYFRTATGGGKGSWQTIATQSWVNSQGFVTGGPFVQNILGNSGSFDLNVSGQQAFFRFSQGTWVNAPTSGNYSHVLSVNAASDNRTFQVYFGDVPGYLWWRPCQGPAGFHPWERILTSNNYNGWAPTLTGGGASGTWGINISGNSSTTSQRNFSGDISTTGMGRFTGWYNGNAATGLAAEIGISSGEAYIIAYNRQTSSYGVLNLESSAATLRIGGSTVNVVNGSLQQGGNQVLHAGNYNSYAPTLTGGGASGTWSINVTGTAGLVNGTSGGAIQSWDIRTIAPNSMTAGRLGFGFTSWSNNNSSPWADFLHLRSYTDSSGGNDNLVMFLRNGFGMRIYQQTWGSGSAYSSYKDVAWTDGTNSSGTWGINVTGNSATATILAGVNVTFNATSTWNPQGFTYQAFGQRWANSNISADTGDFVMWLRASQYSAGGTEVCMIIDGDYFAGSGQYKVLHAGNYNSYAPTLTGGGASGTWAINITGGAASANLASNSNAVNGLTVNQIFNNQGSAHSAYTNFDSVSIFGPYFIQGTANGPGTGSSQYYGISLGLGNEYPYSQYAMQMAIPRYNSTDRYISYRTREATTWGSWNKIWAGYADSAGSVPWSGVSSKPSLIMYYQGFTLDANTMDGNSTGFTYSVNAPYTGPIARISETGYSLQLNAAYSGGGTQIAFRTRNGDTGSFNGWRRIVNEGSDPYAANMNQYVRTTDSVTFAGITLNGVLNLPQNPQGTTYGNGVAASPPYMISQGAGTDDGIRIYAESTGYNNVRMVFELIDDIETGLGDEFTFRNKKTYGDYQAIIPFYISGGGAAYARLSMNAPAFYETSDRRIKDLVQDDYRVNDIESIRPKLYKKNGRVELGYYAQDVLLVMPHCVTEDPKDGYLSLSYREVHTAKIAYLEDSIEEIKAKILYLENQLKTKQ